jgi:hypothetical protein
MPDRTFNSLEDAIRFLQEEDKKTGFGLDHGPESEWQDIYGPGARGFKTEQDYLNDRRL